jgi:hypothetical protein
MPTHVMQDYSHPFLQQDFTFLLPAGSSIRSVAEIDRPEVRIAVVRHHASTLSLAHAQPTRLKQ